MNVILLIVSILILGSAVVAVTRRNIIHAVLLFAASWAGVAIFYLWAGAEFVAFAQLLVYVGAVAMIALFAVLLTRHGYVEIALVPSDRGRVAAAALSGATVFAVMAWAVLQSSLGKINAKPAPVVSVRELGTSLMSQHSAAVLVIGTMLTVALLGAVVLAAIDAPEKGGKS